MQHASPDKHRRLCSHSPAGPAEAVVVHGAGHQQSIPFAHLFLYCPSSRLARSLGVPCSCCSSRCIGCFGVLPAFLFRHGRPSPTTTAAALRGSSSSCCCSGTTMLLRWLTIGLLNDVSKSSNTCDLKQVRKREQRGKVDHSGYECCTAASLSYRLCHATSVRTRIRERFGW